MKLGRFVSTTLPASLLIFCTASFASNTIHGFKVAVAKGAVGSSNVVSGEYHQGIAKLNSDDNSSSFDNLITLCAAQIKTLKLEAAESSCSSALSALSTNATRGRHGKLLKALAYSNRGIARYLNDDDSGAYKDFVIASNLTNNKIVSENLQYLESKLSNRIIADEAFITAED